MRNCDHPAYQGTEHKLRRFAGALSCFTGLLQADGFNCEEATRWWSGQLDKLRALAEPARQHPARLAECRLVEQRLEAEVLERMDRLVEFLHAHAPQDPRLPAYRLYTARWHDCYGEPVRALRPEDLTALTAEPVMVAPTVYGVAYERLEAARVRLCEMHLRHLDLGGLAVFLCGLSYGAAYQERHGNPPTHEFGDGLREVAREALDEVVDYANKSATVTQVKQSKSRRLTEASGRMLMALCHAQHNHTPAVYEWLCRGSYVRDLASLLFAMGVRAVRSLYARGFIAEWRTDPDRLMALLPDECGTLIAGFRNEE
jgi:hypothetical protein